MNSEKAKALLPVITAFAEGKEVQVNSGTKEHPTWFTRTDLCFDWAVENYRVKPEPREFGIILRKDGSILKAVPAAALNVEVAIYNVHGTRQSMPYTGIVVVEQL